MKHDDHIEWLKSLRDGDEVCIGNDVISKVTRVTPTQIVTKYNRYSRSTGRKIGANGFQVSWLSPVTDEIRERNLRTRLIGYLRGVDYSQIPTATLQALIQRVISGHE